MAQLKKEKIVKAYNGTKVTYDQLNSKYNEANSEQKKVVQTFYSQMRNKIKASGQRTKDYEDAVRAIAMEYLEGRFDPEAPIGKAETNRWGYITNAENSARAIFRDIYNGLNPIQEVSVSTEPTKKYFTYSPHSNINLYDYSTASDPVQFKAVYDNMSSNEKGKYVSNALYQAASRFTNLQNPETYILQGVKLSDLENYKNYNSVMVNYIQNFDYEHDYDDLKRYATLYGFNENLWNAIWGKEIGVKEEERKTQEAQQAAARIEQEERAKLEAVPEMLKYIHSAHPDFKIGTTEDGKYALINESNQQQFVADIIWDANSPYYMQGYTTLDDGTLTWGSLNQLLADGSPALNSTLFIQKLLGIKQLMNEMFGTPVEENEGVYKYDPDNFNYNLNGINYYAGMPTIDNIVELLGDNAPNYIDNNNFKFADLSRFIPGVSKVMMILPKEYDPNSEMVFDYSKYPIIAYNNGQGKLYDNILELQKDLDNYQLLTLQNSESQKQITSSKLSTNSPDVNFILNQDEIKKLDLSQIATLNDVQLAVKEQQIYGLLKQEFDRIKKIEKEKGSKLKTSDIIDKNSPKSSDIFKAIAEYQAVLKRLMQISGSIDLSEKIRLINYVANIWVKTVKSAQKNAFGGILKGANGLPTDTIGQNQGSYSYDPDDYDFSNIEVDFNKGIDFDNFADFEQIENELISKTGTAEWGQLDSADWADIMAIGASLAGTISAVVPGPAGSVASAASDFTALAAGIYADVKRGGVKNIDWGMAAGSAISGALSLCQLGRVGKGVVSKITNALGGSGITARLMKIAPKLTKFFKGAALLGVGGSGVYQASQAINRISNREDNSVLSVDDIKDYAIIAQAILNGVGAIRAWTTDPTFKINATRHIEIKGQIGGRDVTIPLTKEQFNEIRNIQNTVDQNKRLQELARQNLNIELPDDFITTNVRDATAKMFYGYKNKNNRVILYEKDPISSRRKYLKKRQEELMEQIKQAGGKNVQHYKDEYARINKELQELAENIESHKQGGLIHKFEDPDQPITVEDPRRQAVYSRVGYTDENGNRWISTYKPGADDPNESYRLKDGTLRSNKGRMTADVFYTDLLEYQNANLDLDDAISFYKDWVKDPANNGKTVQDFQREYNAIVKLLTDTKKQIFETGKYKDNGYRDFTQGHHKLYRSFSQGYYSELEDILGSANYIRMPSVGRKSESRYLTQNDKEGWKFYIDEDGNLQLEQGEPIKANNPSGVNPALSTEQIIDRLNSNDFTSTEIPESIAHHETGRRYPADEIATVLNLGLSRYANRVKREGSVPDIALEIPTFQNARRKSNYSQQNRLLQQGIEARNAYYDAAKDSNNLQQIEALQSKGEQLYDKYATEANNLYDTAVEKTSADVLTTSNNNIKESVDTANTNNEKIANLQSLYKSAIAQEHIANAGDLEQAISKLTELGKQNALHRDEKRKDEHAVDVDKKIAYLKRQAYLNYMKNTQWDSSASYKNFVARISSLPEYAEPRDATTEEAYKQAISYEAFLNSDEYTQYIHEREKQEADFKKVIELIDLQKDVWMREGYNAKNYGEILWRDLLYPTSIDRTYRTNVQKMTTEGEEIGNLKSGGKIGDRYARLMEIHEKAREHDNKQSLDKEKEHNKKVQRVLNSLEKRDLEILKKLLR